MTVAAATAKAGPYTGNDSASSFAFSFKVFADADIRVVKTVIASGAESDFVLNTDYTVTRNVDQDANPGGSVTYKVGGVTTALPSTLKLTIVGDFDYAQPTDIPNGGSFFANVIETALDRITMLIKQLKERVDNALTLPVSVSGVSAELPTPEATAVIGWNSAGDALVNYDAASLAGAVAAVDWIVDTFDGTGAETGFVLTRDPGVAANCDVSISGVTQVPGVDFTVSSTSLTFTAAPASGTGNICVRYGSALPSAASVPVDGVATASIQDLAVTTGKIANDAVTYAKMQNVSATSRVLGRKTAAAGDAEECTLSEVLDFIGSAAQGDILYRGAATWARLGAGTSGRFLTTKGAGANPAWEVGTVVQAVEATPITALTTCATAIPNDDTIPQNTEGDEVITVAITPTSATNRLRIEYDSGVTGLAANGYITTALFQDTTADALAASLEYTNTAVNACKLVYEMAAGTTSATTFKIRVGSAAGTVYVNGYAAARLLGGVAAARLRVTEIKV